MLIAAAILTIWPLIWIAGISLMTRPEFLADPMGIFQGLHLDAYSDVIGGTDILTFVRNSILVTSGAVVLVVTCASLAGYALARLRFRGAAIMYVVFLGAQATPILILIVPLFVLVTRMGLGNSLLAVVLPYAAMNMGITVFLMRGFFRTIPGDLEDAARIDGCGQLGLIWRVMVPLARPGIVVAVLLNFVAFWNEYFLAAILLPSRDLFTLPAGIAVEFSARYATNWPAVAAGVMISVLPILLIFVFAQDKIIAGWARSVK